MVAPELGAQSDGPQCDGGLAVSNGLTILPPIALNLLVQRADCFELLPEIGNELRLVDTRHRHERDQPLG